MTLLGKGATTSFTEMATVHATAKSALKGDVATQHQGTQAVGSSSSREAFKASRPPSGKSSTKASSQATVQRSRNDSTSSSSEDSEAGPALPKTRDGARRPVAPTAPKVPPRDPGRRKHGAAVEAEVVATLSKILEESFMHQEAHAKFNVLLSELAAPVGIGPKRFALKDPDGFRRSHLMAKILLLPDLRSGPTWMRTVAIVREKQKRPLRLSEDITFYLEGQHLPEDELSRLRIDSSGTGFDASGASATPHFHSASDDTSFWEEVNDFPCRPPSPNGKSNVVFGSDPVLRALRHKRDIDSIYPLDPIDSLHTVEPENGRLLAYAGSKRHDVRSTGSPRSKSHFLRPQWMGAPGGTRWDFLWRFLQIFLMLGLVFFGGMVGGRMAGQDPGVLRLDRMAFVDLEAIARSGLSEYEGFPEAFCEVVDEISREKQVLLVAKHFLLTKSGLENENRDVTHEVLMGLIERLGVSSSRELRGPELDRQKEVLESPTPAAPENADDLRTRLPTEHAASASRPGALEAQASADEAPRATEAQRTDIRRHPAPEEDDKH